MTLGYEFQPVDVDLTDHPRVRDIEKRIRRAAFGLYVAGLCYSRKHRTEGRLPRSFPEDDDPKLVAELVRVGLWIARDDGGWDIHNWMAKSGRGSSGAVRTKRWREKQRAANDSRDASDASPVTDGDVTVTRHTVTDSSLSPSSSLSGSSSSADQKILTGGSSGAPDWFREGVAGAVEMAGLKVDAIDQRWLEYKASRSRKTWSMNHEDAVGWLVAVLRREKRDADAKPKARGAEATKQPYDENAPWLKLPEVG